MGPFVRHGMSYALLFVIVSVLVGCDFRSSPPRQQVQDTLAAVLPPFLSIESVRIEPEVMEAKTVKLDFKATAIVKENLYRVDRIVEGTPRVILVKLAQPSGTKTFIYGSIEARRLMDLWTLDPVRIEAGLSQLGTPWDSFGSNRYVTGTSEANAALQDQAAKMEARKADMERQRQYEAACEKQRSMLPITEIMNEAPTFESGQPYVLIARHNGKVLDVGCEDVHNPAKPESDRNNVLVFEQHSSDNQKWLIERLPDGYYRLSAMHNGYALTVGCNDVPDFDRSLSRRDNVFAHPWQDEDSQKWIIVQLRDGAYRLTAKGNSHVLDVGLEDIHNPAATNSDRDNVLVYKWHGGQNQRWSIVKASAR